MATIQERIKKLGPLFSEMQVTKVSDMDNNPIDVIYVIVTFPHNWIIDDAVKEKYSVSVMEGNGAPGEYYFCADISVGFDAVFDAVDYCIKSNKEAAERAKIFQEKIVQLKEIFGNEEITIEELKNLDFVYSKKKKTPNQKKKTPLEEVAEKEINKEEE